jgi:signal transduction histidine kinase
MFKVGDSFDRFIRHNAERGEYGPGDVEDQVCERVVAAIDPQPHYFERTRPNGHVIEVRRVALPGGGFVTSYIDVTAARSREADLEEARARLEQQTQALIATATKLDAANSAKSRFLANMSHELRTPLNAVIGFSEVLRDAVLGPLSSKYREYARDIHASGTYLLRLINDVLDTSKIEVGQLELHEDDVELAEVARECERLLRDKARDGRVVLEMTLAPDLPLVRADRLRLKQIMLNLLSNAVKFTPPGGRVTLSVSPLSSGGIAMAVADTGIGMRPQEIPLALEPFQQLDNSLARRYEGTGLGLPLTKALVELHGGRLEIESAPGKGTTVHVSLPAARAIATRQARAV